MRKIGIRLILRDSRANMDGEGAPLSTYREEFVRAHDDFGRHPATFGFYVGDEPSEARQCAYIEACRIQKDIAPELPPYINFFRFEPGVIQQYPQGSDFQRWAADFIKRSHLPILCFVCFSQMKPEEEGTDCFFSNLRQYEQAARTAGMPLWASMLSVGHFRYRCPSEDDFRWQIGAAVASGCVASSGFCSTIPPGMTATAARPSRFRSGRRKPMTIYPVCSAHSPCTTAN